MTSESSKNNFWNSLDRKGKSQVLSCWDKPKGKIIMGLVVGNPVTRQE